MEYFKILNLNKEPFSNSPDPDLFFLSQQHLACLQRLEIALRLKRGLCVVTGEVGTGKTTLCRQLIRKLAPDETIETYLILDPFFESSSESLNTVSKIFNIGVENHSERQIREKIKNYLFFKGIDNKKNIILIIDEGQKLQDFFIEILREFLNYETNEYKLLQILIFAQKEFEKTLKYHQNFADRIALLFHLQPLNFHDMRKMIWFRLQKSGYCFNSQSLFTYPALWKVFRATGGYPRKIMNLCHQCILMLIIQNKSRIGWFIVSACVKKDSFNLPARNYLFFKLIILIFLLSAIPGILILDKFSLELLKKKLPGQINLETNVFHVKKFSDTNIADVKLIKEKPEIQNNIPALLGKIEIKHGETLGELVRQVYGTFNQEIIQKLLEINPNIKTPNRISTGQTVSFPCIPAKVKYLPDQSYFIEIITENSLESAFEILRLHINKDRHIPIKLIPYLADRSKKKFVLIYNECFSKKESMQKKINELQSSLNLQLKILTTWDQNTVFFSDPYQK